MSKGALSMRNIPYPGGKTTNAPETRNLCVGMERDMGGPAAAILVRRLLEPRDKVKQQVVSEEFLTNPPISPRYDNQYVFIPKSGDWAPLHSWISCLVGVS